MLNIDFHTVQTLECTAPGLSTADRSIIKTKLQTAEIFGNFSENFRRKIFARLIMTKGLVPTLLTFFNDFKYIQSCEVCVKQLVDIPHRSGLLDALTRYFRESRFANTCLIQNSETSCSYYYGNDIDRVTVGYQQLFIYVMRHLDNLKPSAVLVEPGRRREKRRNQTEQLLAGLASLAGRLGFTSEKISLLANEFRSTQEYESSLPFSGADAKKIDESSYRRSGRPFADAHRECKHSLYFDKIFDWVFAGKLEAGVSSEQLITPFAVRKSIFLAFFEKPTCSLSPAKGSRAQEHADSRQIGRQSHVPERDRISEVLDHYRSRESSPLRNQLASLPNDYAQFGTNPFNAENALPNPEPMDMSAEDEEVAGSHLIVFDGARSPLDDSINCVMDGLEFPRRPERLPSPSSLYSRPQNLAVARITQSNSFRQVCFKKCDRDLKSLEIEERVEESEIYSTAQRLVANG